MFKKSPVITCSFSHWPTSSSPYDLLLTHSERVWPVWREHTQNPEPPAVTVEMPLFGQLSSLPGRASDLQRQCDLAIWPLSEHRHLPYFREYVSMFVHWRGNKVLSALKMASSAVKCLSVWLRQHTVMVSILGFLNNVCFISGWRCYL